MIRGIKNHRRPPDQVLVTTLLTTLDLCTLTRGASLRHMLRFRDDHCFIPILGWEDQHPVSGLEIYLHYPLPLTMRIDQEKRVIALAEAKVCQWNCADHLSINGQLRPYVTGTCNGQPDVAFGLRTTSIHNAKC